MSSGVESQLGFVAESHSVGFGVTTVEVECSWVAVVDFGAGLTYICGSMGLGLSDVGFGMGEQCFIAVCPYPPWLPSSSFSGHIPTEVKVFATRWDCRRKRHFGVSFCSVGTSHVTGRCVVIVLHTSMLQSCFVIRSKLWALRVLGHS